MADDGDETETGGAGSWSIKGFDYQVDVSVWLALDLMTAKRRTAEMILEHVSEEDVEADMEELEPGPVAGSVAMRNYRLIVQAKRRTGNAWTEARYIALLKHGKRRKSAITRLEEDAGARYLLVTSAALNDPVRKLGIRNAGTWPGAGKVPPKVAAAGKAIAGRLAIIGGADDERLQSDIKTLLLERFRVPRARWEECLDALRKAAWRRMRGHDGGVWTRDHVEALIVKHEGYLVGAAEPDDYVEPTNWGDISQALETKHAVMIIGQSGSGKTETARALWRACKQAIPDLKRIQITHGPDQLLADTTLPPVLYDIEDPWGRFKFEPDSRPWNDQLAAAFRSARHDRLFVATSRSDVIAASGAADSIRRWRMPLDAENYGRPQLRRLYRNLSAGLPADIKAFAHEREERVLGQLSLPLELRKFFDALPELDRDDIARRPETAFATAIDHAHRDSIERTVIEQIEARDAIKAAAVLWALIKPYGRLSIDILLGIDDALVDRDPALEDKIGALVTSFVTGRNFRQGEDGSLAYYHGKVEAGIESALAAHPQAVRRILKSLIEALLARDDAQGGSWGVETAAEIVRHSHRIPGATPTLPTASQDRLDRHLEAGLAGSGRDLQARLRLAAIAGSPRSNLVEVARWLEHRPDRAFGAFMDWGKPDRDEAWYARMRADPTVRALVERFVRTILPTDQLRYPDAFAEDLALLAGDVTDAFIDAARDSVGYGFIHNDDVIAFGALADLDRFAPIVDLAIAVREPTEEGRARTERDRLLILNDEVSEDYAEHLADNDDGLTAHTYLEVYVRKLREVRGWAALSAHPRHEALRDYWLGVLQKPGAEPQPGELEAIFEASLGTGEEWRLWQLLDRQWDERFADRLVARLAEGLEGTRLRKAALDCLADHAPDRIGEVVGPLADTPANGRLAELASTIGIGAGTNREELEARREAYVRMIQSLPADFRELAEAERAIQQGGTPALSDAAAATLLAIAPPSEELRTIRVRLAKQLPLDVRGDVTWILQRSDDHDDALQAIDVAIRLGLDEEIEEALDSKFAHVAAKALTALAGPLPAPLPDAILERAKRDSSPVRMALLDQLRTKPHPAHLETLRLLVGDEWSRWARREADDGNYPIARGAGMALLDSDQVPERVLDELVDRAKETEDLHLMAVLLACAVRHGDEARQAQVVELSRKGRRVVVGQAAAYALLDQEEYLKPGTIAAITADMGLRLPAMIAVSHVLTIGLHGAAGTVDALAEGLPKSGDRVVFLALLVFALRDRAPKRADEIAALLPAGHPARRWAQGEKVAIAKTDLIDLGDAAAVRQAYNWMKSPEE